MDTQNDTQNVLDIDDLDIEVAPTAGGTNRVDLFLLAVIVLW